MARIEKPKAAHVEDETGHLWAISYADFLMVLLSFFIIFFSVDKDKKEHIIDQILLLTGNMKSANGESQTARKPAALPQFQVEIPGVVKVADSAQRTLTLHLPDDIYRRGSLDLSDEGGDLLEKIFVSLKPHVEDLDFLLIGHSDASPVVTLKKIGINNNFELSAQRASRAVHVALRLGVPQLNLSVVGAANNHRNTRSLSVQVRARGTAIADSRTCNLAPCIWFLALNSMAQAKNLLHTQDLESRLEVRIRRILQPVDPYAQAFVRVVTKKTQARLPTADAVLVDVTAMKPPVEIGSDDLDMVEVRVVHSLEDIPDWLKKEILSVVSVPEKKRKISYSRMDSSTVGLFEQKTLEAAVASMAHQFKTFFYVVGFLLGALVLAMFLSVQRGSRMLSSAVSVELGKLLSQMQADTSPVIDVSPQKPAENQTRALSSSSSKPVQDLATHSLVALFSDCYWCENDGYASWLWQQMGRQQKEELLKAWPPASEYSRYLNRTVPVPGDAHLQAYYLEPAPINLCSPEELDIWLTKNPTGWAYLSEMRQKASRLPLNQKLKLVGASTNKRGETGSLPWPTSASRLRALPVAANLQNISIDDEILVMENPDLVPEPLRMEIPSLVWFDLLPEDQKRAILGKMSAIDLARAWVGPDKLLEKLASLMPEKKRVLVQTYVQQVNPSRESQAFQFLVQQSVSSQKKFPEAG